MRTASPRHPPLHRLSPAEERLLARFAELLAGRAPGRVAALRVFGSRARGDSDEHSDLDVAVEPARADEDRWALGRVALDAALDAMEELGLTRLDLSPKVIALDGVGIAEVVEREGLVVWRAPTGGGPG